MGEEQPFIFESSVLTETLLGDASNSTPETALDQLADDPVVVFLEKHGHELTRNHKGELITYYQAIEGCPALPMLIRALGEGALSLTAADHPGIEVAGEEDEIAEEHSQEVNQESIPKPVRENSRLKPKIIDRLEQVADRGDPEREQELPKPKDSLEAEATTPVQESSNDEVMAAKLDAPSRVTVISQSEEVFLAQPAKLDSPPADKIDKQVVAVSMAKETSEAINDGVKPGGADTPGLRELSLDPPRWSFSELILRGDQQRSEQLQITPDAHELFPLKNEHLSLNPESIMALREDETHPIPVEAATEEEAIEFELLTRSQVLAGSEKMASTRPASTAVSETTVVEADDEPQKRLRYEYPKVEFPLSEVEQAILQVAKYIDEVPIEQTEAVYGILDKITEEVAQNEYPFLVETPSEAALSRLNEEVKPELQKLFMELFEYSEVSYTPALINSAITLALRGKVPHIMSKHSAKLEQFSRDEGTHEAIKQLLTSSSTLQVSMVYFCRIGESALRLCSLQSLAA